MRCCPQCNPQFACRHQEMSSVIFMHGQTWIYQCRECKCFQGEIDCVDMNCPPLTCDNPQRNDDDCCHHCPDFQCSVDVGNSSKMGDPCLHGYKYYQSGSEFVDPSDRCVRCNCKVGD